MQKLTRSLIALSGLVALAACGDDVSVTPPPETPPPTVTAVTVSPAQATIKVGEKLILSANVAVNGSGVNTAVTWASANSAIASVSATGEVTGVAAGQTTVRATSAANAGVSGSAAITVSADKGVQSVAVSPTSAILAPTQTLQAVANVTTTSGVAKTVTWASSATSVATVDATGKITAVAPGAATITATSTVDPTVAGSLALTVRQPAPATISIKSVTTGATNVPVNFNNVAGQIDATLNVDPGDQVISKVEILLDNAVVYSQAFSAQQSHEMSLAAVSEALAEIVGSIYTNAFDPATGAVKYYNGTRQLSARAQVVGGTQVATPSLDLIFNNQSGFVASITNTGTNAGYPASATNTATGFGWTQGTHTLKLVGVNYVQGQTFTNVTVNLFGKAPARAATPAAGTSVFTLAYSASGTWAVNDADLGGYLSLAGELPVVASAVLSNGQNGPTGILNLPNNALGLTPINPIYVDNAAPGVASANGVPQAAATGSLVMPVWVNASYSYLPSAIFASGTDAGVAGVTKKFYYIAGALPGTANSCDFTGMTEITTGSQLAATTVSTVYSTRAASTDALGNTTCYDLTATDAINLTGTNGADFVAPTIVGLTGPANLSATTAAPGNFAFTVTDNASGFGANPVTATLSFVGTSGTATCLIGTSSCTVGGSLPLTFDATNLTNVDGYYTIGNWTVADQALNTTAVASRTYLLDATAPAFSGGLSLQPLYTGNASASFNTAVTDNIDLASVFGVLTYPTASIQYPSQSIGSYGLPLEKSASVAFNVANFMRCLNPAADFATTTNKANGVDLTVTDQAANATAFGLFAIPAANVETCGAVGATTINTFGPTTVAYEAGKTQVDIDGASLAAASGTTATLTAVADVPINTSVDPFSRVDFYWFDGTNYRLIGSTTGVLAQSPTTRTYTYSIVWNPASPVTAAVNTVVAIGVDSNGDAVLTGTGAIVLVP